MEEISALMDGELEDREAQTTMARLKSDAEFRSRWDDFHLVRDALNGEPILSSGFSERLAKRLAEEPTVLAPRRLLPRTRRAVTYAMSAAASIAAAVLVLSVAGPFGTDKPNLVATVPAKAVVEASQPQPQLVSAPSDGRLTELLLAHEGYSPSSALQGFATYMRTVSTTRGADRR